MKKKSIFLFSILSFYTSLLCFAEQSTLVMLDPAGHAKNVGRRLVEGYERAETFKFAEKLQEALKNKYGARAVLTRYPGEEIVDLQNASFANRLAVDFYLNINMYRQEAVKPKIYMYHLVYNPMIDLVRRVVDPFSFLPIHQSHFANIGKTRNIGKWIKDVLVMPYYQKRFDFFGLFGIPFRPLCGVIAPAVGIEIGICEEDQWKNLVDPLVESLAFLGKNDNY